MHSNAQHQPEIIEIMLKGPEAEEHHLHQADYRYTNLFHSFILTIEMQPGH